MRERAYSVVLRPSAVRIGRGRAVEWRRGRSHTVAGAGPGRASMTRPGAPELESARQRLAGVARVTPLLSSGTIGGLTGRTVSLKAENLQLTGSFKIRGAYNTITQLGDDERARGVVT